MKKTLALTTLLSLALFGLGLAFANRSTSPASTARLTGGGAFDRTYDVSAFSAMIDSDGDATIIHSDANQLRFEETRLLVDGYMAADLTTEMNEFNVAFTDTEIVVTVDGEVLIERARENPRLVGLKRF